MAQQLVIQTDKKIIKRDFAFSLIYSILLIMFSCAFTEAIPIYIQFGISIVMYVPIIYLLICFIKRRNNNVYDVSLSGDLFDYLIIISPFFAIITLSLSPVFSGLYPLMFVGVQFGVGLPLMITFMVFSIQNLKKKKKLINELQVEYKYKENKKNSAIFILSLVGLIYALYFVFMILENRISVGIESIKQFYFIPVLIQQGIIATLAIMMVLIIFMKISKKDYKVCTLNTFISLSYPIASFVSLVVAGLTFLLRLEHYNIQNTLNLWIITFITFGTLIILFISGLIYLFLYFKNKKTASSSTN